MAAKYEIGQTVYLRGVNRRTEETTTVTRVGRTLVYVQDRYGKPQSFRIETGVANDQYGHEWIETSEQRAERVERSALSERLRAAGLSFGYHAGNHDRGIEWLRRVVEAAEVPS